MASCSHTASRDSHESAHRPNTPCRRRRASRLDDARYRAQHTHDRHSQAGLVRSSAVEGWARSTEAMAAPAAGCVYCSGRRVHAGITAIPGLHHRAGRDLLGSVRVAVGLARAGREVVRRQAFGRFADLAAPGWLGVGHGRCAGRWHLHRRHRSARRRGRPLRDLLPDPLREVGRPHGGPWTVARPVTCARRQSQPTRRGSSPAFAPPPTGLTLARGFPREISLEKDRGTRAKNSPTGHARGR